MEISESSFYFLGLQNKAFFRYNRVMVEKEWHNLPRERVIRFLEVDPEKGLTEEEVKARRKRSGLNSLPEEKPLSRLGIFLEQFKSPLIYILVIAGVVTLILKEFTDSIVIFGAVILNTLVGFFQDTRGEAVA